MRRAVLFAAALGVVAGLLQVRIPAPAAAELRPGGWTFGAGLGFLSDTPDGTAFALNGYADYVFAPPLSIGPLLQLGFTGDSSQVGLSGQVKFWIGFPNTAPPLKLAVQGGLGFVHNSFREEDTSWLIPLGLTADYALSRVLSLTGTFLLNFTDLDTGRRSHADVMPGLTFGVRF
jgi:uncharacterized protein with beta-barrel porin domain